MDNAGSQALDAPNRKTLPLHCQEPSRGVSPEVFNVPRVIVLQDSNAALSQSIHAQAKHAKHAGSKLTFACHLQNRPWHVDTMAQIMSRYVVVPTPTAILALVPNAAKSMAVSVSLDPMKGAPKTALACVAATGKPTVMIARRQRWALA